MDLTDGAAGDSGISFENEFELNDMSIDFGAANKMSDEEKATLRNTALIAMILAIVIDIALVIGMLVYFKGFANRIVNVAETGEVFVSASAAQNQESFFKSEQSLQQGYMNM